MNRSSLSRRHLLTTVGAMSPARCMDLIPSSSDNEIRLGSLRVANTIDESQTVDLRFEQNGHLVKSETIELNAEEEKWIEPL